VSAMLDRLLDPDNPVWAILSFFLVAAVLNWIFTAWKIILIVALVIAVISFAYIHPIYFLVTVALLWLYLFALYLLRPHISPQSSVSDQDGE